MNFFRGIILRNFLVGIFWKDIFGRNFWEELFGRNFLEGIDLFVKILVFVKILSQCTRKEGKFQSLEV